MPGFLTHYLFSIDTYRHLHEKSMQSIIKNHKQVYYLGAQGPDIFFYYLPCTIDKKKQLGSLLHHTTTNAFFDTCIKELSNQKNPLEQETILAYISGLLCHYSLDSSTHPFIYARTGYEQYVTAGHTPLSYSSTHCNYETILDTTMLYRQKHTVPSKVNYKDLFRLKKSEVSTLAAFLSTTINKTYFKDGSSSYINANFIKRTLNYMPMEIAFLQDKRGKKKSLIAFLEKYTLRTPLLSSLITSDQLHEDRDVLNLAKGSWESPWLPNIRKNDSFLDLYQDAISSCRYRIDSLYSIYEVLGQPELCQRKTNLLLHHLGNLSYNSGLSCDSSISTASPKKPHTCKKLFSRAKSDRIRKCNLLTL